MDKRLGGATIPLLLVATTDVDTQVKNSLERCISPRELRIVQRLGGELNLELSPERYLAVIILIGNRRPELEVVRQLYTVFDFRCCILRISNNELSMDSKRQIWQSTRTWLSEFENIEFILNSPDPQEKTVPPNALEQRLQTLKTAQTLSQSQEEEVYRMEMDLAPIRATRDRIEAEEKELRCMFKFRSLSEWVSQTLPKASLRQELVNSYVPDRACEVITMRDEDKMKLNKLKTKGQTEKVQALQHPFDKTATISNITVETVFSSKAKPVLLALETSSDQKHVIYKTGDDLNVDIMCLKVFSIFNTIWEAHNIKFVWERTKSQISESLVRNVIYSIRSIDRKTGFIQYQCCSPLQSQWDRNGATSLNYWINGSQYSSNDLNSFSVSEDQSDFCNMVSSSVAMFVSAYVVGAMDRHQDNMLIRSDGCIFHIDLNNVFGARLPLPEAEFPIPLVLRNLLEYHHTWKDFLRLSYRAFIVLCTYKDTIVECVKQMPNSRRIQMDAVELVSERLKCITFDEFVAKVESTRGLVLKLVKDAVHLVETSESLSYLNPFSYFRSAQKKSS